MTHVIFELKKKFFGGVQDINCAGDLAVLQGTFYAWCSAA
jgi:hypothetical protein